MDWFNDFSTGLVLTLTLIIAIGAQNAYVLKCSILRQRTLLIVTICIISDVAMIALGALAITSLEVIFPKVSDYIYLSGALFLFGHGIFSFLAIRKDETLPVNSASSKKPTPPQPEIQSVTTPSQNKAKMDGAKMDDANDDVLTKKAYRRETRRIVLTLLGVTYLNPHFYLDTFFLIGAQVSFQQGLEQMFFFLGCVSASVIWFFTLGYGARIISPLFAKPITWKLLNLAIGILMWTLAYTFAVQVIENLS
ncbi:arginine exporter protein ArgO [Spirochaetota bacterium]|nr:arginine exporter protein ArgO [Spirochaetota bacterium]